MSWLNRRVALVLPGPPGNSESPVNRCGESARGVGVVAQRDRARGVAAQVDDGAAGAPTTTRSPPRTRLVAGTGSSPASSGWAMTTAPVAEATSGSACQ